MGTSQTEHNLGPHRPSLMLQPQFWRRRDLFFELQVANTDPMYRRTGLERDIGVRANPE
jgi:hypothetical protein